MGTTATIQPQGTGGLTTKYSGTIKTDRGTNSISFLSGSTIDANTNGIWKPLADGSDGSAQGDYGGKATFVVIITVNFAGRDFVGGLTSESLPIDGTNHFDLSTTDVTFSSGTIAYRNQLTGDPADAQSIAGLGGPLSGTGTLSSLVQGLQTTETLTIPISSTFQLVDPQATINLTIIGIAARDEHVSDTVARRLQPERHRRCGRLCPLPRQFRQRHIATQRRHARRRRPMTTRAGELTLATRWAWDPALRSARPFQSARAWQCWRQLRLSAAFVAVGG